MLTPLPCLVFAQASSPRGPLKELAKDSLQKSFRLWNEAKELDGDVKGELTITCKRIVGQASHPCGSWTRVPCVSENAESLGRLQGRIKNAETKSKDLLKSIDDALGRLETLPNGKGSTWE